MVSSGLEELSREELLALVAAQAQMIERLQAQVVALTVRVAELERRLGRNSGNSSMPPSLDDVVPADYSVRPGQAGFGAQVGGPSYPTGIGAGDCAMMPVRAVAACLPRCHPRGRVAAAAAPHRL